MGGPSGPLSTWGAKNLLSGSQGSLETNSGALSPSFVRSVPNIWAVILRGFAGALLASFKLTVWVLVSHLRGEERSGLELHVGKSSAQCVEASLR